MNFTSKPLSPSDTEKPGDAKPVSETRAETLSPDQRIDLEVPGMRLYYIAMTHLISNLTREKDANKADGS